MRTNIPEKVLDVVDEIEAHGSARATQLTVLNKWFEEPMRLRAFGLWIARRTAGRKGKTKGEAGALLDAARKLLGTASTYDDMVRAIDIVAARELWSNAAAFQNTGDDLPEGPERQIHSWPVYLVELGLGLYLGYSTEPTDGYHLAVAWVKHSSPIYGESLNSPSQGKLKELVRFMFSVEAIEDTEGFQMAQKALAIIAPPFAKEGKKA